MTTQLINILVIEDVPADAKMIELHLKDSSTPYVIHVRDSLFDGIEASKSIIPHCVLLDLSLPDSSGFKTLDIFLKNIKDIPVIVLTGMNNEIVGSQAIKAGAEDFIVKGQVDYKLLSRIIRYSIQRAKTKKKLESLAADLARNEKKYKEAQEIAHFGNWEIDVVSNQMTWSDELYRIFGFRQNSLQPSLKTYLEYVHIDDKKKVEKFFDKSTNSSKLSKLEHRIILDGHTIRHVAIQAKVQADIEGGKVLLVGVTQDITDRKTSEQLILEKNINTHSTKTRQEALAEFGFHIRTPLASVTNLLYLLDKTKVLKQNDLVNGLKTSFDDLSIMIRNLINFSTLQQESFSLETSQVNIHELLQSIQKIGELKSANASLEVKLKIAKSVPEKAMIDAGKINQVLYNILDLSIQNSNSNGVIELKADAVTKGGDKMDLQISFLDNGNKYSKKELTEMAEKFTILSKSNLDTDQPIGLAIATKLVEVMNGKLEVKYKVNIGTEIKFIIPINAVKSNTVVNQVIDVPIRILLVEDHFLNQLATKKLLTAWSKNVSVDIADNGLVGFEKFIEYDYDIILMDLQMPVMNGFESAKKIREKSQIPIIGLSASASKSEAMKCSEVGMNDYLSKPFKPEDLFSMITSFIATTKKMAG